jgi:tetratricopeptide (TPR) repeat protein
VELGGYRIEGIAGRGGMGLVYRARQRRPERVVALKVISPEAAADPAFRRRFEQEAVTAAEIEHPNVIPVYDVGEEGELLYIAMCFVEGTDLRGLLANHGPLEPGRASRLIGQVSDALDAAHSRGLVHRDVKPGNVLVTRNDHVYLTDFGITKRTADAAGATKTGAVVGTPDYIAPEQIEGRDVDARADVYALGCMTYELLSGRVPFPRESEVAKIFAHLNEPPPRLGDVAPALADVVQRAMAKSPEDRFASAGDLGQALIAAAAKRDELAIGHASARLNAATAAGSTASEEDPKRFRRFGEPLPVNGREDTAGAARLLHERLGQHFGWDKIAIDANVPFKRVLALLALVITLVGLYQFYRLVVSGAAAKRSLTGDLNIAVAGFAAAPGTNPADARGFSDSLFRTLSVALPPNVLPGTNFQTEVAGPAIVGRIDQDTDAARETVARRLDSELQADILIYGVVRELPDGMEVTPEFYFSRRDVTHPEDRQALFTAIALPPDPAGPESLGTIRETGMLAGGILARARLRTALAQRARAFAFFILGLAWYTEALDRESHGASPSTALAEAARSFRAAQETQQWDPRVAYVLYLFLGNVALAQHQWLQAAHYYETALRSRPNYLRAQFALAEAHFHLASGACTTSTINASAVGHARDAYARVLKELGNQRSVLRSKTVFGLGRAALCLGLVGQSDQLRVADQSFRDVIADYARGLAGVRSLAAGAYGGLGLSILFRNQATQAALRTALSDFQRAILLMPPSPAQGALYSFLGFTFAQLNEARRAMSAYQSAIRLDPTNKAAYQREASNATGQ